jgi:ABC-type enterobactin transport system permease subunit
VNRAATWAWIATLRRIRLSDASEKLQINFSRFLWSSMLANVTMPLIAAAAAKPISDIQNK